MTRLLLLALAFLPSACAVTDAAMPGKEKAICETDPDACQPASTVLQNIDEGAVRVPTDASLIQGNVTRIWIEPLRMPDGELTRAGFVYLE